MKITIAGYGFVGKAHAFVLKPYHEIIIVDPKIGSAKIYSEPTDAVIVCVSTPRHNSGACNINHVYEVISDTDPTTPVLIKSTISLEGWLFLKEQFPKHNLTFSPEFLRAETAETDFKNTKYLHYGGDGIVFWEKLFKEVFPNVISVHSSAEELILTKYFRNAFLATKVSFFNQVHDMCSAFGIDYERVAHGISIDPRIGYSHTEVTATRGWGGHCFPKDVDALLHTADLEGVDLSIIKNAVEYNNLIRK